MSNHARQGAVALSFALSALACGDGERTAGPTMPIAPPPTVAVPPRPLVVPPGPSLAVVEIAEFRAQGPNGPKVVLVETGGRNGAYLDAPILELPNGGRDYGCGGTYRIEAGGRWDMDSLGYCAPSGDGTPGGLTVIVTFVDDEGRPGSVTATIPEEQR